MTSLHRPQQSLSNLESAQLGESLASGHGSTSSEATNIGARAGYRHSLDLSKQQAMDFNNYLKEVAPVEINSAIKSPPATQAIPPKLQTSFSANDIHAGNKSGGSANLANANAHAQQHFHNHNASIGRIPPGAVHKHNRELSNETHVPGLTQSATYPSISTALQGNAPAFGPSGMTSQAPNPNLASMSSPSNTSNGGYPSYYGNPNYNNNPTSPNGTNYNMGMLMQGMGNMNVNGYPQQNYTGYGPMFQPPQPRDSQQRVMQQRRAQDNEGKRAVPHYYA